MAKTDGKNNKYDRFFSAFLWSYQRLKKAKQEGFFIESLVLIVSSIDALLRILIYQKSQIKQGSFKVQDETWFIQEPSDNNFYKERNIIEKALKEKVIDKKTKESLVAFLNARNNFIHRTFIGNWRYRQLKTLVERGEKHIVKIQARVKKLSEKQVKLGILPSPVVSKEAPQEWKDQSEKILREKFEISS